ncbi:MAG TPA: hypothetical protein VMW70_10055 [Burkholderiales bacterium]|nr:hypothetical protein [Burkholderiales bacterium]
MAKGKYSKEFIDKFDLSGLSDTELSDFSLGRKSIEQILDSRSPSAPTKFEIEAAGMADAPSPFERFDAGVSIDIGAGIKQKYLNITDPPAAAQYTKETNEDIARLERGRMGEARYRGQDSPGFDAYRAAGSGTPLMLAGAAPGGAGPLARIGIGSGIGGTAGYGLYSQDNTTGGNLLRTGLGAVGGGIASAAAPWLTDKGIQGLQWGANKVAQGTRFLRGAMTPKASISNTLRIQLENVGVDFNALSADAQQAIATEAQATLRAGGQLNAQQLLRNADIEAVGGRATKGMITGSPNDWTIERNLQKTEVNLPSVKTGSQETITGRLEQNDAALKARAGNIGDDVYGDALYGGQPLAGSAANTPFQASTRSIQAVQAADRSRKEVVDGLYKAYRDSGMKDTRLGESHITKELTEIIDDFGIENVPPAVVTRLKEFAFLGGERTRYLTIQEADQFNRLLNNNNPGFGPMNATTQKLRSALTRELLAAPDDASAGASQQLLQARSAAAEMFSKQEAGKGVASAVMDVAPDKFLEQNVLGGTVRDLQMLKTELTSGPDSGTWNDLRSQAWKAIIERVTQDGRAPFSGARLDKELKKLGEERLRVIFTQPELQQIQTLRRASLDMTSRPPFSAVNDSNTTPAMLGQVLRLGNKTPFSMITKPISEGIDDSMQQGLLSTALGGSRSAVGAAQREAQDASRNAMLDRLFSRRSGGGLLGATPMGATIQNQR